MTKFIHFCERFGDKLLSTDKSQSTSPQLQYAKRVVGLTYIALIIVIIYFISTEPLTYGGAVVVIVCFLLIKNWRRKRLAHDVNKLKEIKNEESIP